MNKQCKDCLTEGITTKREANSPGPRCATHWRIFRKQQKAKNHENMVAKTYGLAPGEYEQMYQAQGGVCAICQRATGKTKRLAVDHDHDTGLVRGLLCGPCNRMVGYFRNAPEAFRRAAAYLERARERNRALNKCFVCERPNDHDH